MTNVMTVVRASLREHVGMPTALRTRVLEGVRNAEVIGDDGNRVLSLSHDR
jgi:hypothetical protein